MSNQITSVSLLLLGFLAMSGAAAAQAPEGHEQHHPAGATEAPAPLRPPPSPAPPPAPGSAVPDAPAMMDMPSMMREMERMMSGVRPKPLVARLLDAERMTEAERNSLRESAERRVQQGLELLERGTRDFAEARRRADETAIASALQTLEEGAAQWQTGRAVIQALESPTPRSKSLQWFKAQMNLDVPSAPRGDLWGVSRRHAAFMAIVVLIAIGGIGIYAYKVGRSLRLLARLSRDERA